MQNSAAPQITPVHTTKHPQISAHSQAHRATGDQAFFVLDANTLPNSAKELAKLGYVVVVAADNDQVGVTAAKASGLPYVVPQGVKDFWELFDAKGLDAVTEQLSKRTDPDALALFDHVLDIDLSPPKWLRDDYIVIYIQYLMGFSL